MKRIETVLRAGVAFAALAAGALQRKRKAPLPPRRVVASTATTPIAAVSRPARSSSPARASAAIRSTRTRRSCSSTRPTIDKTGLSAIADVLQRIPSAGGGLNTKVNTQRQPRQPARRRRRRRRLGRRSTCAISAPTAPWCWSTACASSTARAPAAFPARSTSTPFPTNMIDRIEVLQAGASPLYGSDAIAGVVNIITVQQQRGPARLGAVRHISDRATARRRIIRRATASQTTAHEHRRSAAATPSRSRSSRATARSRNSRTRSRPLLRWRRRLQQRGGQRPLHRPISAAGSQTISNPPDSTPTLRRTPALHRLPTGSTSRRSTTS